MQKTIKYEDYQFLFAFWPNKLNDSEKLSSALRRTIYSLSSQDDRDIISKCCTELDYLEQNNSEANISKAYENIANRLDGVIPAEKFGKILYNDVSDNSSFTMKTKENILNYFTSKYPETKNELHTAYGIKTIPAIFNNYFFEESKNKEKDKQIPEWIKDVGKNELLELLKKKDFKQTEFFKFLELVNVDELENLRKYKGNVLDQFKEWHKIKQDVLSIDTTNPFNFSSDNTVVLKAEMEINLNPLYFQNKITSPKEKSAIESFLSDQLGSRVYGKSTFKFDKNVLKVSILAETKFTDANLEDEHFQPYTDTYSLKAGKNRIKECLNTLNEMMEVPEFVDFYKTYDTKTQIITKELENSLFQGLVDHRERKEALSKMGTLEKSMDNSLSDSSMNDKSSHTFKI